MAYLPATSVTVDGATSIMGDLSVTQAVPYVRAGAWYNLIPANFRSFTTLSGTTGAENKFFRVSTGTGGLGASGAIQSFRALNFRAGSPAVARCGATFPNGGVANAQQGVGLLAIGDELSFGYSGTSFGVWHRYDGIAEVETLTVTAGAGGTENGIVQLNNINYAIALTAGTTQNTAAQIAAELQANASASARWAFDQQNSTVIVSALSDGPKSGTYSFSSDGTATGTFVKTTAGVTKTSDFIAQTSWSGTVPSGFSPTNINSYQIKYFESGVAEYSIYDVTTGKYVLGHRLTLHANANSQGLSNPAMRSGMYVYSIGTTANVTVRADTMSSFVEGLVTPIRNPRAYIHTQDDVTQAAFTSVLSIRNRKIYNGLVNQIEVVPRTLYIANDNNSKSAEVEIRSYVSSVTTNLLEFTSVGSNLVVDVSEDGQTYASGGRLLSALTVGPVSQASVDLTRELIRLPPTITLTVFAKMAGTATASASITAALTWYEDV